MLNSLDQKIKLPDGEYTLKYLFDNGRAEYYFCPSLGRPWGVTTPAHFIDFDGSKYCVEISEKLKNNLTKFDGWCINKEQKVN